MIVVRTEHVGLSWGKIELIRVVCKVDSVVFQPVLVEQDPIDAQGGAFINGSGVEMSGRQIATEYRSKSRDYGVNFLMALDEYT